MLQIENQDLRSRPKKLTFLAEMSISNVIGWGGGGVGTKPLSAKKKRGGAHLGISIF